VLTASVGGDVDSGCMRLQVTQEFYPPCIGSAKVLTFFFCFLMANLVPKKNENVDVFFRPKNKTPNNKKSVFWRRKIKENEIRSASITNRSI